MWRQFGAGLRRGQQHFASGELLPISIQLLLLLAVVIGGAFDLRSRRIPNWVTVPAAALGLLLNLGLSGVPGLTSGLLGLGLAFLIYFPLFLLRGMGAGDVKLMGAVGAIVGPGHCLWLIVIGVLISAAAGLIVVISKGRLARTLTNVGRMVSELIHFRPPYAREEYFDVAAKGAITMPHGTAVAVGTILYLAILHFR